MVYFPTCTIKVNHSCRYIIYTISMDTMGYVVVSVTNFPVSLLCFFGGGLISFVHCAIGNPFAGLSCAKNGKSTMGIHLFNKNGRKLRPIYSSYFLVFN